MTHDRQPEEPGGDYSYDLVHEDVQRAHHEAGRRPRSSSHPVTAEGLGDVNGDYSYDLAHDIPTQHA
jgi:hypothetical protein